MGIDRQPVRIVIADELPIFRDGLRLLLATDARLQIVGAVGVGAIADRFVRDLQPDVLLLGCSSSGAPAVEMLRRFAAAGVAVRTILIVASIAAPEVVAALQLGARGVLERHSAPELLFQGIDAVAAGHFWIGDECAAADAPALVRRLQHAPADAPRLGLTAREREIVRAVVNGETNREIAERLAISDNTVKRHIMNIFDKVGCSKRVELALFAAHHRLLGDE